MKKQFSGAVSGSNVAGAPNESARPADSARAKFDAAWAEIAATNRRLDEMMATDRYGRKFRPSSWDRA